MKRAVDVTRFASPHPTSLMFGCQVVCGRRDRRDHFGNLPQWHPDRCDGFTIPAASCDRLTAADRFNALRYMCKGTDWGTAMKFGICKPNGSVWKCKQGRIPFKRAGHSQSLGRATRLAMGLLERDGRCKIASTAITGTSINHG